MNTAFIIFATILGYQLFLFIAYCIGFKYRPFGLDENELVSCLGIFIINLLIGIGYKTKIIDLLLELVKYLYPKMTIIKTTIETKYNFYIEKKEEIKKKIKKYLKKEKNKKNKNKA